MPVNGDVGLVGCLVDRLAARLPHRTGTNGQDLLQDEIVAISRSTLIQISSTSIPLVLECLLSHLEDLTRTYQSIITQPPHVLLSVQYILSLASDCCSAHWRSLSARAHAEAAGSAGGQRYNGDSPILPGALDDDLVTRFLDTLRLLVEPLPDGFTLPTRTILEDSMPSDPSSKPASISSASGPPSRAKPDAFTVDMSHLEADIRAVVEYLTAANWDSSVAYLRRVLYVLRPSSGNPQVNSGQAFPLSKDEALALAFLRLLSFFYVDGPKLGVVVQEICSSFLHFKKPFQNTISLITALLITRWIDTHPHEFVRLHDERARLYGAADTLFDMTQAAIENGRRKAIMYPLQIALLFLIPDVFEVASTMRQAKSTSMSKKVAFLDTLKKSLTNRNEHACYCLVSLLRVARHFDPETDAAIVSYAMEVQDEVRDAVFRRSTASMEGPVFDQDMMTAAFVSVAQLNLDSSVDSLIQTCLAPTTPVSFKTAVVQGCYYFAKQGNALKFQQLFVAAAPYMQSQLEAMATLEVALDPDGKVTQHEIPEASATAAATCEILQFMEASPGTLFDFAHKNDDATTDGDVLEWFLFCSASHHDEVRRRATAVVKRLCAKPRILDGLRARGRFNSPAMKAGFWRRSSQVLSAMSDHIDTSMDSLGLLSDMQYLQSRVLLLGAIPELAIVTGEADMEGFSTAVSKLEKSLLVSLCSPDLETCQRVTACIGAFVEECSIIEKSATPTSATARAVILRNGPVFRELASRDFRLTGLVAFQKRVRTLLRRLQYPTGGILAAWELAFEKWVPLSREIASADSEDAVGSKTLAEWRNYSGFLASLGGLCTAGQASLLEEPAVSGLRWIDRLSSENNDEPLLTRYLRLSIRLLACADVRVREATREVLTLEISSTLFQPLFRVLESELEILFAGNLAHADKGHDVEITFSEQTCSLLRGIVDRLESPSDLGAASSIHLGSLTLDFAKFLDGMSTTHPSVQRVKIKVCQLCEAVTRRKEYLNLRDDVRIRNQLLECIFGWISDPRTHRNENTAPGRHDDAQKIQRDLDKACLRSLADLTFRLPLQPAEGQSDAGTSELKSQMFLTYFTRFLSLLNYEPQQETRRHEHGMVALATRDEGSTTTSELAITILSNLLSANIDVGLKHSLNIGYHDNVEIRTAFVKVLYNILMQGTEFSNLSDAAVSEKYDELLDLLTKDVPLAAAMGAVCPSSEVDELTISLLTIFEHRGMSFQLLEALIKQEVDSTENESELLRRNCVATKMLSIYAKWKGASYLKTTLQKVVERLMLTSNVVDLELDPARVDSEEELHRNAHQLRIVAKAFIDHICSSTGNMPASFRTICSIISSAVLPRFQEAKYTAVGAFIFLRFFCPAIVAPEVEGLVATAPTKEMRRGLLLIAKVIQNLANNVLFGAKEPYMFTLNEFLAQNIYKVTTFLRDISIPPAELESPVGNESFDFGSCVALHRFLYDHWDHVRQRLVTVERREFVRSPGELSRNRNLALEPLRNLITNLGPPPLAVTWNRPQISTNTLPNYSRFQNFMLRNAFRGTESFLTARAVYDGGESKDGLSIICVILRNIDTENIDFDTILYCYLKIASRLWHRPFGLFIDATCYSGQTEPQDDLFKKLELLVPTELSRALSRVYIYNMNSAFRRCFRRLIRVSAKNTHSVFNPKNVDYYLMGTIHDLQAHFHLSQLNLPSETISVVSDTRYVFQPVTKLSKSKGNVDVVIKVGSQFVQVTTAKKSELFPGFRLQTTVNDIFRLGDVDEAQPSLQPDDDSAFGIRADSGKMVMFFTSPQKAAILQSIRGAKTKYGKDSRAHKAPERLIRPQDVPGTLLNLALTNISSPDAILRLSSYNLLGALCRAFEFSSASRLMCTKDLSVPSDPSSFILNMSEQLARSEPQLTYDFLTEFFVGWDSFSDDQKPLSLAYMAPWLSGLRSYVLVAESDGEKARDKVAVLLQKLVEVALSDHSLTYTLEQAVWPAISNDEVLLDIFLDEVTKTGLGYRLEDENLEVLSSVIAGIGTITLRGKVISRLKKALNRSSLRPTRHLADNAVWSEICVLLQFCLALSFDNGTQVQLYLPEVFHIVTMLANTGPRDFRARVHKLLVNSVHSICTSFNLDEARLVKLRGMLDLLGDSKRDLFPTPVVGKDGASTSTNQEYSQNMAATEALATLLFDMCSVAAPSVDLSNAWRSRWMSLVASTAFQNNPAIQPKAFAVMGCLAREEVDDDLLYQVLVALRSSVGRFVEDSSSEMLVSIVAALSKMLAKLPTASRYGLQLFWLAISLLRLVPPGLFNCTAQFLEAVLANIGTIPGLKGETMVSVLMQGRAQLEEAAVPLDEAYGVRFSQDNFHFAVCASLARGLTDTVTRTIAMRVLSAFLGMTVQPGGGIGSGVVGEGGGQDVGEFSDSPYMALILARAPNLEELRDCLWFAGISPSSVGGGMSLRDLQDLTSVKDKDLLLNSTIELVDFQYLEDAVQIRTLQWLNDLTAARPGVVSHLREPIVAMLDDILLHCQNSTTLGSAHALLRTMASSPRFSAPADSGPTLVEILEDMGFGGLWRMCSLNSTWEADQQCFTLTEKLIELTIV